MELAEHQVHQDRPEREVPMESVDQTVQLVQQALGEDPVLQE